MIPMIRNGWRLESASLEVRDHGAHDLENDDREQHAIDGGCRGRGEWLPAYRQVVGGVVQDDPCGCHEHERDCVVDQVLADSNHADVRRAPEQTLPKNLV